MNARFRTLFKIAIALIFLAAFALYGFNRAGGFLDGPKLSISYPQDGQTISNSELTVKGETQNISQIYLNGRKIFVNEEGFFEEGLLLARGYNIIEVKVEDKFGRKISKLIRVILK
jgi:hypothetical protein